jgi:hypothetical protein
VRKDAYRCIQTNKCMQQQSGANTAIISNVPSLQLKPTSLLVCCVCMALPYRSRPCNIHVRPPPQLRSSLQPKVASCMYLVVYPALHPPSASIHTSTRSRQKCRPFVASLPASAPRSQHEGGRSDALYRHQPHGAASTSGPTALWHKVRRLPMLQCQGCTRAHPSHVHQRKSL